LGIILTKEELIKKTSGYNTSEGFYLSWDDTDALAKNTALNDAVDEFDATYAVGTPHYSMTNIDPSTHGRQTFTRQHYAGFRPEEGIPTKIEDILLYADGIYHKVGIIRNIIDLMGDFACQGIRLSHPNKRYEKFYKNWFVKISGKEKSERFLNNLFRLGNIVIRRQSGKINLKQRAKLFRSFSKEATFPETKIEKNTIPIHYTFLHPASVRVIGEELAAFSNVRRYGVVLPMKLRTKILSPQGNEKYLLSKIPQDIINAAKSGDVYLLPENDTLVYHYKKDDWQCWAYPMIYSIAEDIILLKKLKLADIAALDGAISNIRIFKLGSLDHKIAPSKGAAAKLRSLLQKNVGAGTIDIVWGPDIELMESKTDVHKFLGEAKYTPTLNNIFGGMGIPSTLTGFGGTGTTNNYISLSTLIQRLKYGRDVMMTFWQKEIAIVQEAMGFDSPAYIEFDYPDLGDSKSEKALLIQMSDRNLISDELLREKFGHNNDLELERIKREFNERSEEDNPPKFGPFVEGQPEVNLERIALQRGVLTPEQVGVKPRMGKSKDPSEMGGPGNQNEKDKGIPQQGRPVNSKDSEPRKEKEFRPKTKASLELWAKSAQEKICEVLQEPYLTICGKKNVRSLTHTEHDIFENAKFCTLLCLKPFEQISESNIKKAFNTYHKTKPEVVTAIENLYNKERVDISSLLKRQLSMGELRDIQAMIYSDLHEC